MHWRLFADLAEAAETREVELALPEGSTVGDALDSLIETHPKLDDAVFENGDIADHLTILLNGRNVETEADGLATTLDADDELALFPPISGG